jgi:Flp pilus assembly pilin Flp
MKALNHIVARAFVRFREAHEGQGYTEYALILASIGIAAIVALQLLGTNISAAFNSLAGQV